MSVPEQVKKAGERATQLLDRLHAERQELPGEPQKPGEPGSETDKGKPANPPETPPKNTEQPDPPPKSDEDKGAGYWKDRFSVLQGKYNAEVPRLQRQVKALETRNQELEQQLQASKTPGTTDELPAGELFTQEEREQLGDDILIVERVARRIAMREAANAVKPVRDTIQKRAEDDQAEKEEKYWTDLYRLVGGENDDPEKINKDPGFQEFLAEIDPFTGRMRDELLKEAHAAFDATRVAHFFNTWLRSQGAAEPSNPDDDIPPDGRPGAGSGGDGDVTGKVWTRAEIKRFYDDVSHGAYRGREDEKAAIERDIMAAQREGRIHH